jgi:hypothetical protein
MVPFMVSSSASSIRQYLTSLHPERRAAIAAVRRAVNAGLPPGFEETMQFCIRGP